MRLESQDRILLLAPHPDDEIGASAFLQLALQAGCTILVVCFSDCSESMEQLGIDPSQLLSEFSSSMKIHGIDNYELMSFPVRSFSEHRQAILEAMVSLRSEYDPSIVLTPSSTDMHQDHHCIHQESVRAFKHSSILGYEVPWNMLESRYDMFLKISNEHLNVKLRALELYKSQLSRSYANRQFFSSLANVRGVQAGTGLAECYEVIRVVL